MHCFRCSYVKSFRADRAQVRDALCIKRQRQPLQRHTRLSDWGQTLWASTQELSGIAVDYLQARHHNGYQCIKSNLQALHAATMMEVLT
jgi:hypothetical protein